VSVDVIVPVHGAGAVFARCAASLAAHLDPRRHRLIVIVDGPADADVDAALASLEASPIDLVIEREPIARGFVQSANRGLRLSRRDGDVVLLNSDTQVTAGWLDKLAAAAASEPRIATVTPFSNNATICSLPRFLDENTIPAGYDLDAFAALVERSSQRVYPRLPTGVGACLYITRRALDEIGLFDEAFGLGYGEETDFCLRASARGYVHILDDATFIYHEGSRSFSTQRAARVRRAHRLIRSRYPGYWPTIADFIARDPLAAARARVIAAMRPFRRQTPHRRVLHVVHGWPPWAHGGTEIYAYRLAMQQRDRDDDVAVYARIADPDRLLGEAIEHDAAGVRVRLVVNNFTQRNPFCRAGFHCRRLAADFAKLLDDFRPDVLHVHHLAGHCASLMGVAHARGVPIVYQVQDWWPLCARANFIDSHNKPCSGPTLTKCARCLPITGLPGATVTNPLLYAGRRYWLQRQLWYADAFVMGSRFIADTYEQARILPDDVPRHVLAYGVPEVARAERGAARKPLRFGYIGALLPHKGVHVAIEAFAAIDPADAELHIWGVGEDAAYRRRLEHGRATFHGVFPEADKNAVMQSLDALIVPSIGLESFGIAAREALAHGVPVLASRLGALAELADVDGAMLFEPGDVASLARLIQQIIANPRRHIATPTKTVREHADEIDRIYDEAIKRRTR
jgi:glycosyltransferase involved in cell wall biosynthesis/GT2 family glycosyltransferase